MISHIKAYFKFLGKSTNQYGVHSPFVFDLLVKCLYDSKHYAQYDHIKAYRRAMLNNNQTINVTDFGAGSRVFKSDKRRVSDIARNAGISRKRAHMLFRICRYFECGNVLEIGTSVGLATSALAAAQKQQIVSLEGCRETANVARHALAKQHPNVKIITGEFSALLASNTTQIQKFDLIYFDGNHQKDATMQYFEQLLPTAHNNSVWIFDDIHWSEGMEVAWDAIKKNSNVTVTIDTFQWGIVFFRREQRKENFIVRV